MGQGSVNHGNWAKQHRNRVLAGTPVVAPSGASFGLMLLSTRVLADGGTGHATSGDGGGIGEEGDARGDNGGTRGTVGKSTFGKEMSGRSIAGRRSWAETSEHSRYAAGLQETLGREKQRVFGSTAPGGLGRTVSHRAFSQFLFFLAFLFVSLSTAIPAFAQDRPELYVGPASLSSGEVGTPFSATFYASDGSAPYRFTLSGTVPPGLNFEGATLSGTPTQEGNFDFRIFASDSSTPGSIGGSRDYTLTVDPQRPAYCPTSWDWTLARPGYGSDSGATPDNGSVSWPLESTGTLAQVLFSSLETETTASITSSNPSVVKAGMGATNAYAELHSPGSTMLEATFDDPACDPIILNVTVAVTEAPTANDTTTTVAANSTAHAVTLDIDSSVADGSDVTSVAVASGPSNGTATVLGTGIAYTPNAGFSGADSFTYTATNPAGTSAPATAEINVIPAGPPPTVTITDVPTITNTPFRPTFTFSQVVTGFQISDIGVTNGTASGLSGSGDSYTALITPLADGLVTIDVAAGVAQDGAGNDNTAAAPVSTTYDATAPRPTLAVSADTQTGTINVDVTFTEDVIGLDVEDFSITNGSVVSLSGSGAAYTLAVTPSGAGDVRIALAGGSVQDAAGNNSAGLVALTLDAPDIAVLPAHLPLIMKGDDIGTPVRAEGGTAPHRFSVTDGALPEGLTLNPDGSFSGAAEEAGSFTFTITARDDNGFASEREYTLAVDAREITLGPDALAGGSAGTAYGPVTFTADGGTKPYRFTLTGDLPSGLTLAEDGSLSGTPTEAGSFTFTVTATDANDMIRERGYTLSIDAPEITVTAPSLSGGNVNAEYGPVRVAASGGTGPYIFDLAAGTLPAGMAFDADGTLSGTPTEDGAFTVTFKATDAYGFEGTADAMLTINPLNVPVAQDLTLAVMAGTSGSVDLTQGATGGPFTGSAIVSQPASEAGEARIEPDGAAHLLHFAASGAFAGTAGLTYTLTNAEGTSEPATITLTVIARPDPSLDPEVIGLIRAQTETAQRFANTQNTNFNQRLEQLHNEGERRSNSLGLNVGVQQPAGIANAYAREENTPHDPAVDAIGQVAPAQGNDTGAAPAETLFGDLAFWSGGYVNFGTNDDGAINLDHTLVGGSAGVDYRFTPELTAGLGVGYGRDVTDIGSNGTESRAEAFSAALYGSYRPLPGFFIDGLAGYSAMSFESLRFVTATGDFASGSRSGDQLFAALSAGYEYRNDGLLISPYGRLSSSHSTLDAFTETGAGIWNLAYGEQTIKTLSGKLGLRFAYDIPTDGGMLTPRGRIEYTHDFEGSSRASLGYADIGTTPYDRDIEGYSRDYVSLGLGLDAQIGDSTTLGIDYSTAFATNGDSQDHTFGVKLGVQF